jgi:hypothetical protein
MNFNKIKYKYILIFFNILILSALSGQVNSQTDTVNIKSGVVKNTNLLKIDIKDKAEIIVIKELYSKLGINKFNRTYRTISSLRNIKLNADNVKIEGDAVVIVVSGEEGIIILFAEANNLSHYAYACIKQKIVKKGNMANLYHSMEDGIQRPDLVSILDEGIAWVSNENADFCKLNYIPFTYPRLITTFFASRGSTENFNLTGGKGSVSIFEREKIIMTAEVYENIGEEAQFIPSKVKWEGKPRNYVDLNLNIIEDSKSMAGRDVLIEFNQVMFNELFNYHPTFNGWESLEQVKPMNFITRENINYLPYLVVARNSVCVIEIPVNDGENRIYKLGDKPYNVLESKGPKYFQPMIQLNKDRTIFGYLEVDTKDADKLHLSLLSPLYRAGLKIELQNKIKDDFILYFNNDELILKEDNNNIISSIGMENLYFYINQK